MSQPSLTVRWQKSELDVIPARHFCHVFADQLNRICANPASKPEAIAVELGPETVRTALTWLAELGVGTQDHRPFPVMLALLKRNRMIRASFREKAVRLQRESGKDITEFSPDMLRRELGFSEYSVLYLSPIDSIIEGLRCGLELGVPVQGIDLEEAADGIYRPALIEDPQAAGKEMGVYLARNLAIAESYRDDEIDSRREWAMAARLKTLLMRHKRVVFTCGMAHWLRIQALLFDDAVRPAVPDEAVSSVEGQMKRVVVHPEIAARYMDLFPAVVRAYEKRRLSVCHPQDAAKRRMVIDTEALYRETVRRGYKKYFSRKDHSLPSVGRGHAPDALRSFEDYLGNLCRLRHSRVPDLFATVQAGKEVIDGEFAKVLGGAFMEFPWTSPKKHPGCAVLSPSTDSEQQAGSVTLVEDGCRTGRHFFVRSIPSNGDPLPIGLVAYEWENPEEDESMSALHAWHPWNCLISAMSFQARKKGGRKNRKKKAVVFEGSILDGIDVKPTIRAFSRGEEHVYVRDSHYESLPGSPSLLEAFPVVWILAPGEHPNADWNVLVEPSTYMEKHIRDQTGFRRVVNAGGKSMVVVIGYGSSVYGKDTLPQGQTIKMEQLHGILMFQPISWSNAQFACWAELTRYKRNPFCTDTYLGPHGGSDLQNFYAREHDLKLGEFDWSTTLLLLALPFTRDVLTVVIPDGYRIERCVYEKAKRYGVSLVTTPARMFPPESVTRISVCHLAPVIKTDPECAFSRNVEQAIGEPQSAYRHLLPPELVGFGGGR